MSELLAHNIQRTSSSTSPQLFCPQKLITGSKDTSYLTQKRILEKAFGDRALILQPLLQYGHQSWDDLGDVSTTVETRIQKLALELRYATSNAIRDVLIDKLRFQVIDTSLGSDYPEMEPVRSYVADAHSRGKRLMVLEVDPLSSKSLLKEMFSNIFDKYYAVGHPEQTDVKTKVLLSTHHYQACARPPQNTNFERDI